MGGSYAVLSYIGKIILGVITFFHNFWYVKIKINGYICIAKLF